MVFFGNCPITWSAKKQATVSWSSTETEYRALASTTLKLCWICMLLHDLGIFLPQPPLLWCDNVGALAIASNPIFHAWTKHIRVDYHFIREKVLRRVLLVKFITTHDQLADIFTEGLPVEVGRVWLELPSPIHYSNQIQAVLGNPIQLGL